MIVEQGAHQLSDGKWIEAGKVVVGLGWKEVLFEHVFDDLPVAVS
jgi:hypothetical protein